MAHSLSARKRVRQNEAHRARNRWRKNRVRNAVKQYNETILHGSAEDAQKQLRDLYKLLDQVAASGSIHKNAASRTKSRLAAKLNTKQNPTAPAAA
ncbi:MAG: 30S ribosomal protein S20 [Phycisphaera sp.]|nr:30S ribosomal protein S20 [Phycisphaera sp.]